MNKWLEICNKSDRVDDFILETHIKIDLLAAQEVLPKKIISTQRL